MSQAIITHQDSPLTRLCKKLEHYETPEWAARAIFKTEVFTPRILEPCVGTGPIAEAAKRAGHQVEAWDIHDWGYPETCISDFLKVEGMPDFDAEFSAVFNPPFSLAEDFVLKAMEIGARKVCAFQRMSWWESEGRESFWDEHPPNRIYICGSRATCWRHDVPASERVDSKGRPKTTPTAHAWFVWEKGHPPGTVIGRLYRQD